MRHTFLRTAICAVALVAMASLVEAQPPQGGQGGRGGMGRGRGMFGMMATGTVASVSADSIKLAGFRGNETEVALAKDVKVNTLKLVTLADIKEAKWATVYQMAPFGGFGGQQADAAQPAEMQVLMVLLAPKMPDPMPKAEAKPADADQQPRMMQISEGTLTVEGDVASLKVGDKTEKLNMAERSRIWAETPAKMDAVKPQANVFVATKTEGEKVTGTAINILPEGESIFGRGGRGGRGGGRGGRGGGAPQN